MGISELWDVLKPGFGERIQFEELVVHFIDENGRTPRVAVDAYILIFQSTHSGINVDDELSTIIRNFMAKLLYLTSLNVSYVVVFDGRFKPDKLRGSNLNLAENCNGDYEKELSIFQATSKTQYGDSSILIEKIKLQLDLYKIDYVQAPGEGEAECAQLQKFGVVDFVLSGDVDALVFGATKILRNFSKYVEDTSSPSKKNNETSLKYYVTPIEIDNIIEKTGLDRKRLILLASFRGGDYSSGIQRIGIKNATRLAQCGTAFANVKSSDENPLPDLANEFLKCFIKDISTGAFGYKEMYNKPVRDKKLKQFTSLLRETINIRSREIFKRSLNLKHDVIINDYYTLLYLFPVVNEKLFMFMPGALSCGDIFETNSSLKLLNNYLNIKDGANESIYRTNNLISPQMDVGILKIQYSNINGVVEIKNEEFIPLIMLQNIENYSFQRFNYPLKYIILKLLAEKQYQALKLLNMLKLDREKIDNGITFIMVKYDIQALKEYLSNGTASEEEEAQEQDSSKVDYVYIPKKIVLLVNPELIREFDNSMKLKRMSSSPKRKVPTQKTTLDFFGQFPKSPTKKKNLGQKLPELNRELLPIKSPFRTTAEAIRSAQKEYTKGITPQKPLSKKPPPKKQSPKKHSPKKHSPKKRLLPGQRLVDQFFIKKHKVEDTSYLESNSNELFVSEEQDEFEHDMHNVFYTSAQNPLNSAPTLKHSSTKSNNRTLYSTRVPVLASKPSYSAPGSPCPPSRNSDNLLDILDNEGSDTSSIQEIDSLEFNRK